MTKSHTNQLPSKCLTNKNNCSYSWNAKSNCFINCRISSFPISSTPQATDRRAQSLAQEAARAARSTTTSHHSCRLAVSSAEAKLVSGPQEEQTPGSSRCSWASQGPPHCTPHRSKHWDGRVAACEEHMHPECIPMTLVSSLGDQTLSVSPTPE